jgi:hypothetical protein
MAFENLTKVYSWPALGDLSSFQFYPVTLATSSTYPQGYITTIGATATKPVGILQDAPSAAGQMAAVALAGISKCAIYTGTVAVLDAIGVRTDGCGGVTTTDNQWTIGTALEKATDAGVNTYLSVDIQIGRY